MIVQGKTALCAVCPPCLLSVLLEKMRQLRECCASEHSPPPWMPLWLASKPQRLRYSTQPLSAGPHRVSLVYIFAGRFCRPLQGAPSVEEP